ncbi:RHS repeat-associated core domain-containing protein [Pseudomonas sp. NEEL19]|nr:RHS repeat-associated core domain-containing protein [Pseudomonas sp. NEEL19]
MTELEHTGVKHHPYSPYGQRPTHNELNNPMAFNGQKLDLATGGYLLGNGYRLFSPALNRFCGPDNLSPFERGGLNTYAYCAGDPVNRTDPTGHAYGPGSTLVSVIGATSVIVGSVILAAENGKNSTSMKILGGILIAGGGFILSMQAIDLLSTRNAQRAAATLFNQPLHGIPPNRSPESDPTALNLPSEDGPPPAYDELFEDGHNFAEPPPTYASLVARSQLNYNPQPTRHQAPQGLDNQAEHITAIRTGEPPGRRH